MDIYRPPEYRLEPNMALDVLASQSQAVLVEDSLVSGELQEAGPDAFKALSSRTKTMGTKMGERIVLERIRASAVILMHMRDGEVEGFLGQTRPAVPQVLGFLRPMESKVFIKAGH